LDKVKGGPYRFLFAFDKKRDTPGSFTDPTRSDLGDLNREECLQGVNLSDHTSDYRLHTTGEPHGEVKSATTKLACNICDGGMNGLF
jgi:hypothetical protein